MARFRIELGNREVRIETRTDKLYHEKDDSVLQLSIGIPDHTGWAVLSRSQAQAVAKALVGLAHDLTPPSGG